MNEEICYKIITFDEIGSTNDYAKSLLKFGENVFVFAKRQTGGRGTKGRSFVSEIGGVYLSRLTFYEDFSAKNAFSLMASAATAVCETLRFYGVTPCVKWPNDVHVNGKKICGILVENVFSGQNIRSSIVGVGLNVENSLPQDLQEIATALCTYVPTVTAEEVGARLMENLREEYPLEKYFAYLGYMGQQAELLVNGEKISAKLLRVETDGGLVAETADGIRKFSVAEISLRV